MSDGPTLTIARRRLLRSYREIYPGWSCWTNMNCRGRVHSACMEAGWLEKGVVVRDRVSNGPTLDVVSRITAEGLEVIHNE